jgi:hypothetical protein
MLLLPASSSMRSDDVGGEAAFWADLDRLIDDVILSIAGPSDSTVHIDCYSGHVGHPSFLVTVTHINSLIYNRGSISHINTFDPTSLHPTLDRSFSPPQPCPTLSTLPGQHSLLSTRSTQHPETQQPKSPPRKCKPAKMPPQQRTPQCKYPSAVQYASQRSKKTTKLTLLFSVPNAPPKTNPPPSTTQPPPP